MANERIKQDKLCETCISRLICPLAGRACHGHNSSKVFKGLLAMLAPNTDWDRALSVVEEVRKSDRGHRSNE